MALTDGTSADSDGTTTEAGPDHGVLADDVQLLRGRRWFLAWGAGSYVLVTAVLVVQSLAVSDGVLVYLIDDPAIHLSMARTLAETGTWGVVPGEFQSASSAPLWTLALSLLHLIAPPIANAGPLLLNIGASLTLVALLARSQSVLLPSRSRLLDGPAVAVIVVFVLFLPALTMLGMEHVAHMALVVTIVGLWTGALPGVERFRLTRPTPLALVLLAVATLVRFETAFVAVGLAVATLAPSEPTGPRWPDRSRCWRAAAALAASGSALVAFSLVNLALGQGVLPNSVLAKGQLVSGEAERSVAPLAIGERLIADPMVLALVVLTAVAVVVGWRRRAFVAPCLVFLVSTALHMTFASVGWYERYQAYLIALGVVAALQIGSELRATTTRPDTIHRVSVASLLALACLLLVMPKISLTAKVPMGVADTYRQRYQAGIFLDRYYDGRSVATGELGYISLLRSGPLTDLLGLGDFEVLQLRRSNNQVVRPEDWSDLAAERGIEVAAVYPFTLWTNTPEDWILVGSWVLEEPTVTAFEPTFQFWATSPEEVAELQQHLVEFESELPEGTRLELDEFADLRAEQLAGD